MANPFIIGEIPPDAPFCNRINELHKLTAYARNHRNVVFYAPRRFGKTSLVKRMQAHLSGKGFIVLYIDLYGATSLDDVAMRIAQGVYHSVLRNEALFRKSIGILKTYRPVLKRGIPANSFSVSAETLTQNVFGADLLESVMNDLGEFIRQMHTGVHVVFDEFQEITKLNDSHAEAIMHTHITTHDAAYFFVGSRRKTLMDMFNQRRRPFFGSGLLVRLRPFAHQTLVDFIIDCFRAGGKVCPAEVAAKISTAVSQHPYYSQKLSFYVFELTDKLATTQSVAHAYRRLLEDERHYFEVILQGLTAKQILLLKALASDLRLPVFSTAFLNKCQLSLGTIQKALPKLSRLDLIEKDQNRWRVVDPVFGAWLKAG